MVNSRVHERDYPEFIEAVRHALGNIRIKIIDDSSFRPAAVFILFMNIGGRPHVLLTKRTDKVKTHKGQISLPGGAMDVTDSTLLDAAYRETWEEVGIPRGSITYLGRFDDYLSITSYRVATFAGAVEYPVSYRADDFEIEEIFEAPFDMFLDEKYDRVDHGIFDGNSYEIFYYKHNGHLIWGLTSRILTDLARLLRGVNLIKHDHF